jgi:dCTP deaminase
MAREHRMIEPFEERQVRGDVISYGLSSYGYDIRVADEFRIFTNVYAATVDPKAFDERSFVRWQAETCIVPPNSFALARSVEYFRIPRSVLTLCVGKSTYARCFRGDTRVALVDGTASTLEEMAERSQRGDSFWGYSVGPFGRIIITKLEAPRYIGRDSLLEIRLDNEERIQCTADHEFLLRNGTVTQADALRPGGSLMPLYRESVRGYESVYQPLNGHLLATHRLSDEWNLRNGVYPDAPGTHRHHRDLDRRNNNPWNIERLPAAEHVRLHNERTFGPGFDPEAHGQAIRATLRARAEDPQWSLAYSAAQRDRAVRFWTEEGYAAAARARLRQKHRENWTQERRAEKSEMMTLLYQDPDARRQAGANSTRAWRNAPLSRRERQRELARMLNLRAEIDETAVEEALIRAGTIRGAARRLGCDRSVFRRFPNLMERFRQRTEPGRNHRVAEVRGLRGEHDVYCLTVPEAGNFALEAGVFTLNCGIIVNVTPFEPEWEGHVTLEISNTTPLPAKIYANEGIAQVLFFESDEPCTTSYADRGGKYQAQRGVTLPKL